MIFHGQLRGLRFCGLGGGGVEEGGYKVGLGGWKILGRGEQSGVSGGGTKLSLIPRSPLAGSWQQLELIISKK